MSNRIYIKPETFFEAKADASEVGEFYAERINGKVTVQYGNEELVVWAHKFESGSIYAYGFVGKYRTGTKLWNVTMNTIGDRTSIWYGRDDRAGSFYKTNCIFYTPEVFFA